MNTWFPKPLQKFCHHLIRLTLVCPCMKQQTYRIRGVWIQVELAMLPDIAGLEIKDLHLAPPHTLHFLNITFFFFLSFLQLESKHLNFCKDFWGCPGFEAWVQVVLQGVLFGFSFFLLTYTLVKSSWFYNILIGKLAPAQSIISSSSSWICRMQLDAPSAALIYIFWGEESQESLCKFIFPFPQFLFTQALGPQTSLLCMER